MILKELKSDKKYQVIYSDPPWKQQKGGLRKVRPNQNRLLDYSTLDIMQIRDIHKQVKDNMTTENHVVFLWTIDKYLHDSEQMMTSLGYRLHARFVWDKFNGIAPAFTVRFAHEYLLWFYKSKLIPIATSQRGKFTTVFREKSTKHSKKPLYAYEMIESLYPESNKLELFARNLRDGWDSWGNEI